MPLLTDYDNAPLVPGDTLKGTYEYVVESEIGRGGVGIVFRVRRTDHGEIFAAKILSGHRFPVTESSLKRFFREVDLQRNISGSNIIRIVDVAYRDSLRIPIMEWAGGGSLYERLLNLRRQRSQASLEKSIEWIYQIMSAMGQLHEQRILHRDLTPKNILFRSDGTLAISDFGIAKHLDAETLTQTGEHLGSLIYISAQQRMHPHECKFQDDIFAIGQIAFEIITGAVPHGNPGSVVSHRKDVPEGLVTLLDSMRSYEREHRPASAVAANKRLHDALLSLTSEQPPALKWPKSVLFSLVGNAKKSRDKLPPSDPQEIASFYVSSLEESDAETRETAERAFRTLTVHDAVTYLFGALRSEATYDYQHYKVPGGPDHSASDRDLNRSIERALVRLGAAATPNLLAALIAKSWVKRRAAVVALGQLKDSSLIVANSFKAEGCGY